MSTTSSERGLTLRSPGRFLATATRLIDAWRALPETERAARGALRDQIVRVWMHAEAYQLQTLQTVTATVEGRPAGAESSLVKLWWSELDVALHETALDLLGPDAALDDQWARGFQFSLSGPIYAGTNEVQRNVVAERVLGLPRK